MENQELLDRLLRYEGATVDKKSITLEMAHRLPNHNGKCRNIHGHSWKLSVSVVGKPERENRSTDEGMVVDFSILKDALKDIECLFDHALTISLRDSLEFTIAGRVALERHHHWWGSRLITDYGPINIVPFAPTSENLARLWGMMLKVKLPQCKIISVAVNETCTSEAVWFPKEEV